MTLYKLISILLVIPLLFSSIWAVTLNENGAFTVDIDSLQNSAYNDDIQTSYNIKIKNNNNYKQKFEIKLDDITGWTFDINPDSFTLESQEKINVELNFEANSEFNYATNVRSPDTIVISQKNNYMGYSEFPVQIIGDDETVDLNLELDIQKKKKQNEIYHTEFPTKSVSPEIPLNFVIRGENIFEEQKVQITLEFANEQFNFIDTFNEQNNYHIYEQKIPASINPGIYDAKITIRLDRTDSDVAWEWDAIKQITIDEYRNIDEKIIENKNFFTDKTIVTLTNLGNKEYTYDKALNSSFFKNMFLSSDETYAKIDDKIIFRKELEKGTTTTIEYTYNYIPLYIILLVIIIIGSYIFIRKNSNPLDVEINLYEVKRIKHEGVKQLKVKIGFENIKENEIDHLSIVFRMPKYLNIKDNSFLLTQPNQVLKGQNQYKLVWDFKRFEKNETRILGFTLVNARGILGDIKIPDLEIETKIKGKIKKYFKSVPLIKG